MKTIKNTFKTIAIMAIVFGCSNNSATSQEEERLHLAELKSNIEHLVSEGTCSNEKECDFIAFGSKPCGGPWSYLVYSTTIDVKLLKEKVKYYNSKEHVFNKKWGIASDCMMAAPPTKLECIDGVCKAVN
jgi:hypothetical protein